MNKTHNAFFASNSIKSIPRSSSYSTHFPAHKEPNHDLNPKAFAHREVFNNKMYQTNAKMGSICSHGEKFFKINISKKERLVSGMGDEEGRYLKEVKKALEKQPLTKENSEVFLTLLHHFSLVEKETKYLEDEHPLKFSLLNVNKYLEEFILFLHKEVVQMANKVKEMQINILEKRRLAKLVVSP